MNKSLVTLLKSTAAGAGLFGIGRLLGDLRKRTTVADGGDRLQKAILKLPKEAPKEEQKEISKEELPAPVLLEAIKDHTQEEKKSWVVDENEKVAGSIMSVLKELGLMAGGSALGFHGAKFIYDTIKERQMKAELDKQEKAYVTELSKFKDTETGKSASLVDLYCEAVVEIGNEKQAASVAGGVKNLLAAAGLTTPFLVGNALSSGLTPEQKQKLQDLNEETGTDLNRQSWSFTTDMLGDLKPLLYTLVGGTALYSAYALAKAREKKLEKEQKMLLPSTVSLPESV